MTAPTRGLPRPVVRRLPKYLSRIHELRAEGKAWVAGCGCLNGVDGQGTKGIDAQLVVVHASSVPVSFARIYPGASEPAILGKLEYPCSTLRVYGTLTRINEIGVEELE